VKQQQNGNCSGGEHRERERRKLSIFLREKCLAISGTCYVSCFALPFCLSPGSNVLFSKIVRILLDAVWV